MEVLIAAGLAAIVSLGIASMMQNMYIERKKTTLLATLDLLKIKIASNIRDQSSWSKTMADSTNNPTLACLITNSVCNAVYTPGATPDKLVLRDSANNIQYDLLDWAGNGSNGFTEAGKSCTIFNSAAGLGTDECPISYRLVSNKWCPGAAATCTNPQVKVTARLVFNPATNGMLDKFRGLVSIGSLTSTMSEVDSGHYDVGMKRTAVETNRSFRLIMLKATGGSANDNGIQHCAAEGVGSCATAFAVHPLNWTIPAGGDPANLVTISGGGKVINFNEAGPYSCKIDVPAFATMGFTAELYNATDGVSIATASTVAGLWSMSLAIIDTKFAAATGKNYILRQKCQNPTPLSPDGYIATACTLGFHTQPYNSGDAEIVAMNCFKIDKTY